MKATVSEKEFSDQVVQLAKLCGWLVAHFRPARVRRGGRDVYETPVAADGRGFPDLLLCRDGVALARELKVGKNQPTPDQHRWLAAFAAAGIDAGVWRPEHWPEIERTLR